MKRSLPLEGIEPQHIASEASEVSHAEPPLRTINQTTQGVPRRAICELFLVTRFMLLLVTYLGPILLTASMYSSVASNPSALFGLWDHWDALHFLQIAEYGYRQPTDFAFFPLYPLLIAAVSHVVGHYLLVGMLLSNAALLGALFLVYRLAADVGGEHMARRTLFYICLFPTAFYLFAAYNESLFLFFSAAVLLGIRRQRWWLAGLLGLLASVTRSAGILLVIPYLYEFWVSRDKSVHVRSLRFFMKLLPVGLIPFGTLLYSGYCWYVTGNPLIFASVQADWGRHASWPWQPLWNAIYQLIWVEPFGSFAQVHLFLDLGTTIVFILLAIVGRRRLPISYTLWVVSVLLLLLMSAPTGGDTLVSNQRIVLELFPAFITLAIVGSKYPRLHQIMTLFFPAALATLSIIFLMGRWMV